ncbi:hypothetical protein Pmani_011476 [Petrolisthes manimaculis]|uniref:Uncharacterized protein n=1 Tax=Petrolisthes manimaculis TaxID=1843537 RepID=A0AAE1PZI6_9EUCA|nr:hypothetical protein Pmani_011476 [Petrolisthes manimaculis]
MYRTVFLVACVALMSPTPVTAQQCLSKKVINNECETYTLTSNRHNETCTAFETPNNSVDFYLKPGPNFSFLEVVITFGPSVIKGNINNDILNDTDEWYHIEMKRETLYNSYDYTFYVNGREEYVVFFDLDSYKDPKTTFNIKGLTTYSPDCNPALTSSTPVFFPLYLKVVGYVVLSVVIIIIIITVLILVIRQLLSSPLKSRQNAPETQAPPENSPTPPGDDAENHIYLEPIQFVKGGGVVHESTPHNTPPSDDPENHIYYDIIPLVRGGGVMHDSTTHNNPPDDNPENHIYDEPQILFGRVISPYLASTQNPTSAFSNDQQIPTATHFPDQENLTHQTLEDPLCEGTCGSGVCVYRVNSMYVTSEQLSPSYENVN